MNIQNRNLFTPRVKPVDQASLVSACLRFAPDSVLSKVWPQAETRSSSTFVKTELPPPVIDVCKTVQNIEELRNKLCPIQPEVVGFIERETLGQFKNPNWRCQRMGRITASHFHDVHTKMDKIKSLGVENVNTKHLIDLLLGVKSVPDSLPSLKHGREMEPKAKVKLVDRLKSLGHINVKLQDCGLYVMAKLPFLAASPDAIVECDCCGLRVIEIKCPMPRTGIPNYLEKIGEKWELKFTHKHRTQLFGQMAATNILRGYFYVYMLSEDILIDVEFDAELWAGVEENLEMFYYEVLAPKLLLNKA